MAPASAFGAAILAAGALVVVGGVLGERTGLLAISGVGGAAIGLLSAGATVPRDGEATAAMRRDQALRSAVALAILAVVGGAVGTWVYGRLEGGVLDPLTYLWTVFGPFIPAEIVVAVGAAAWGASAGPVRGRS